MKFENVKIEKYETYPFRDDKGRVHEYSLHSHIITVGGEKLITVGGEKYSFLAYGWRQWIFQSDTVSFEWVMDATSTYRNINKETIVVRDKKGNVVVRPKPFKSR